MIKETFQNYTDVDVVEEISYEIFQKNYLSKLKPVVIKRGIKNMPAIEQWNIEYLQKKIGHKKINLDRHHDAQFEWSMEEYFQQIMDADYQGPKRYLTQANIVKLFPELLSDLQPYPEYGLPDWKCNSILPKNMFYDNYQMELLMGKAGTGFFLHYDRGFINAFVGQVYGEKDVVLIPPEDTKYLYVYEDEVSKSKVDIWNLDEDKYPDVRKARPAFYTLKPGDLVYIPANWWHTTRNKTNSIGVTFNSINRANWRKFSHYLVERHKMDEASRYPSFVLNALLKFVGVFEFVRELFLGIKPRKGGQQDTWRVD